MRGSSAPLSSPRRLPGAGSTPEEAPRAPRRECTEGRAGLSGKSSEAHGQLELPTGARLTSARPYSSPSGILARFFARFMAAAEMWLQKSQRTAPLALFVHPRGMVPG